MVDKDFRIGDLVWAKMKGYPPWPSKIVAREKPPFKKKHHHYVFFFGSDNYAWILDEHITPHSQSLLESYENKKTLPALRVAIGEFAEYCRSLPSTSTAGEDPTSICDEDSASIDNIEDPKPGPSKIIAKGFAMKNKKNPFLKKKRQSLKKGYFGTKNIRFGTNKGRGVRKRASKVKKPRKPPVVYCRPTSKKIGFLGLGAMGMLIVQNLLKSGHNVTVWDRNVQSIMESKESPIRGAIVGESPKQVAEVCDIIFSCLVLDEAFDDTIHNPAMSVVAGIDGFFKEHGIKKPGVKSSVESCVGNSVENSGESSVENSVESSLESFNESSDIIKGYVELTHIRPQKARDIALEVVQAGGTYLEVPTIGTLKHAEKGTLTLHASGNKHLLQSCETVFHAISSSVTYINRQIGAAMSLTLIGSGLAGTASAAISEGFALAYRAGISMLDVFAALNILGYNSHLMTHTAVSIINNKFNSPYLLDKQQEDLKLALGVADAAGCPMPIMAAANESFIHAKDFNFKSKSSSVVYLATKFAGSKTILDCTPLKSPHFVPLPP